MSTRLREGTMKGHMRKAFLLTGISAILAIEILLVLSAITDAREMASSICNAVTCLITIAISLIVLALVTAVTLGSMYYAIRRFMDAAYGYNSMIHKHGVGENQPEIDNCLKGLAGLIVPGIVLWIASSFNIPMMMAEGYQVAIVSVAYLIVTAFAIRESLDTYRDPKKIAYLEKLEKGYYRDRLFG